MAEKLTIAVLSVYVTTLSIMAEFQSRQFKADSFPCHAIALNLTELLTEVLYVNCLGGSDIDITFKMKKYFFTTFTLKITAAVEIKCYKNSYLNL
jgi:hypothetical protein